MKLPKCLLAVLTLTGVACLSASAQPVGGGVQQIVEEEFHLNDFSIQRLDLPAENTSFMTEVTLGGVEYAVWIEPESFRSDNATAATVNANGEVVDYPLPAPLTVRGQVEGSPDARAAGSRMGGGLHLTIVLPGAHESEIWTVQPLNDAVPDADPALHVVHRADDMDLGHEFSCGVDHQGFEQVQADGEGGGSRAFLVCELAVDGDYDFYRRNGSSEANTINDIDNVMARITAVYEGQCNVTFQMVHYLIWTSSNDPYTSTNPETRLNQFRNWWQANMGHINRDLAHLFTGVNIDGGVIGIAWLSSVCTSNGYGLSESRFTSGMNARGALTAHELGHNFSAGHCDGNGDCHIMCSGLGGCNGLGNPAYFGTASANRIRNYAAGRPCLDEGGPSYPFFEDWADGSIDPTIWASNSGGQISTAADNEPSPPNSLNLDGTDSITSAEIDLSGVSETPYVTVYAQHKGVEAGKTLEVQFLDFRGVWVTLFTFTSDGNDQTEFVAAAADVPATGWNETFALRIVAAGADSTDDWYVDDISIAPFTGNIVPFVEEFDSSFLNSLVWGTVNGADVSTDATNEPSEPYSMRLRGTDSAESNNFLMASAEFPSYISFYTQHKGVETGESLVVEYYNNLGNWNNLTTITSNGSDQNLFTFYQQQVELDSYHDAFAVRIRAEGSDSSDTWYFDDLRIGDEFTPPDPCYPDFNGDGEVNTVDVLQYLNAWNAGDPRADCNGDTEVNSLDVLCFLNAWNAGC